MPVVRFVTEDELQAAADEGGFVITFRKVYMPNRTGFTIKSQLVKTKTKKGETVEEVVEYKPNDCEPFRAVVCGLYGDRKGFVWTNGQNMYRGDGTVIEHVPPPVVRPPLTKEHKKALLDGKKRALEAKRQAAAEGTEQSSKRPKQITLSADPEGDALFAKGFYRRPCVVCGEGIERTGKRGRAPIKHETCVPIVTQRFTLD